MADLGRHSPGTAPSLGALIWNIMTRPGLLATALLRCQEYLVRRKLFSGAKLIRTLGVVLTGADFVPGCTAGPGLYMPHPQGVVFGSEVHVGSGVTVHQNVTLGQRYAGTAKGHSPVIGDDAMIGAGAVILGAVNIGRKALVGANSVVLMDVPPGARAIGVPAHNS